MEKLRTTSDKSLNKNVCNANITNINNEATHNTVTLHCDLNSKVR